VEHHRQHTGKERRQRRSGVFRPQRHLSGTCTVHLPVGGGERVCLGKALAELEIRLPCGGGCLKQLRLGAGARSGLHPSGSFQPLPKRKGLFGSATQGRAAIS